MVGTQGFLYEMLLLRTDESAAFLDPYLFLSFKSLFFSRYLYIKKKTMYSAASLLFKDDCFAVIK